VEFHNVGELIRYHRRVSRLTQETLAKQAGVSASWLSLVEAGLRLRPDPDMLRNVARALDVDADVVLELAGYQVPPPLTPRDRKMSTILREALAIAERLERDHGHPSESEPSVRRLARSLVGAGVQF
jgi:transcriptional regulator with XRE-family HTH domain